MKFNKWSLALAATGVVSMGALQADEAYPVSTLLSSTTLSGFVDTSAIWNFDRDSSQLARFANTDATRQDGFNLNVVKLELEKPLDESDWAAGYRVDMMFGPDAAVMPGVLGAGDVALQQAYVALRVPVGNGIDLKVGQFNPTIGYEVADSYINANFSRSLGFNNLEPFGHTGVLATYQATEVFGFNFGVANTAYGPLNQKYSHVDPSNTPPGFNRAQSQLSYMAGIVLEAPEETGWLAGSSLYAGVVRGYAAGADTDNDPLSIYVGGSMSTPWEALTLGAAWDHMANAGFLNGASKGWANAYAAYFSLALTESLRFHGRAEYADSNVGVYTGTTSAMAPGDEQIFAYTATVDYSLWANVLTRVEFRWDRDLENRGVFGGSSNDLSLLLNVVYRF